MRIDLHIERLVLDGLAVTAADAQRVRTAMEDEVTRLLAGGALNPAFATGGAVPRIAAPQISLGPRERPDGIGRAVARSVHRGIGRIE
jgi:hypothetical protein